MTDTALEMLYYWQTYTRHCAPNSLRTTQEATIATTHVSWYKRLNHSISCHANGRRSSQFHCVKSDANTSTQMEGEVSILMLPEFQQPPPPTGRSSTAMLICLISLFLNSHDCHGLESSSLTTISRWIHLLGFHCGRRSKNFMWNVTTVRMLKGLS